MKHFFCLYLQSLFFKNNNSDKTDNKKKYCIRFRYRCNPWYLITPAIIKPSETGYDKITFFIRVFGYIGATLQNYLLQSSIEPRTHFVPSAQVASDKSARSSFTLIITASVRFMKFMVVFDIFTLDSFAPTMLT